MGERNEEGRGEVEQRHRILSLFHVFHGFRGKLKADTLNEIIPQSH